MERSFLGTEPPYAAPSVLSSDFSCLRQAVETIEAGGGDLVHLDVMDGSFVPVITFGAKMVADIRAITRLPLDVHLMIREPERHVDAFIEAGADLVTVHAEAAIHLHRLLTEIKERGAKAGVSIVPSTPVESLTEIAELCDLVLVMTVNPGFGGQQMIPRCLEKVAYLKALREREGYSYLIEVDGGINERTAPSAIGAGAEVLVAGSAVFSAPDPGAVISALVGRDKKVHAAGPSSREYRGRGAHS